MNFLMEAEYKGADILTTGNYSIIIMSPPYTYIREKKIKLVN